MSEDITTPAGNSDAPTDPVATLPTEPSNSEAVTAPTQDANTKELIAQRDKNYSEVERLRAELDSLTGIVGSFAQKDLAKELQVKFPDADPATFVEATSPEAMEAIAKASHEAFNKGRTKAREELTVVGGSNSGPPPIDKATAAEKLKELENSGDLAGAMRLKAQIASKAL